MPTPVSAQSTWSLDWSQHGARHVYRPDLLHGRVEFDAGQLLAAVRDDLEALVDDRGKRGRFGDVRRARGMELFGQRVLHDGGLAGGDLDIGGRRLDHLRHFAAGEAQELIEIGLPLRVARGLLPLRQSTLDIIRRRHPQAFLELGQAHRERRHGIADVVQHARGGLRPAGLETVIDQLPPRFGELRHHAIDFGGERADLILALEIEP